MLDLSPKTPEAAFEEIKGRVEKFKALPKRTRDAMNEEATKQGYILPLFRALGWDTSDPAVVSPEEKVSRGRVDYAFRIGAIPRYFLETKKVSEDLTKPVYVKQAIDYAWTKGVTWALLSDFEGLRVFNAEWKESDPLHAQFLQFTLDTYLSDFERLWWLSRAETEQKRLDREAEKVFKKTPRTPITESLFKHLIGARKELYQNFRLYNREKLTTPKMIGDAVQLMLDRLIFIRTAEDREVEGEKLIALVRETPRNKLVPLLYKRFRELDDVYNSQLFAAHYTDGLECPPTTIEQVIDGLYTSHANQIDYSFDVIDADVLGRVYEQYLGYVFSEHEELEAKKAKRKSQGIYYTPTFVVKYIVQQTLGRYLEENGYNPSHPVRVLDLACGSGSFLIEAFDVLDQYIARTSGQARGQYAPQDAMRQRQILEQNIYGVDKDEQAVEVARLNLLLKALHNRDKLPMLKHIQQGDSLISGTPEELEKYFGASWKEKIPFDWQKRFPEVFYRHDAKDAKDESGFDVIVGNPPYVRAENMPRAERDFYMNSEHFDVVYRRFDIHILFVERAIKMLSDGGRIGFIIPFSALTQNYGKVLRKLILDNCAIETIVDLSAFNVFQEAEVATSIIILRREKNVKVRETNEIKLVRQADYSEGIKEDSGPRIIQLTYRETVDNMFRLDLVGPSIGIADKVERKAIPLGTLCYVITGFVAHDSATGASKNRLIHDRKVGKNPKPYIEVKETAGRYAPLSPQRYIEYTPKEMHRPKFPELFESPKILIPDLVGSGNLRATIDYRKIYTNHSFNCCVLKKELLGVKHALGITEQDAALSSNYDLRFILGLVNSKLITFYFKTILGGGLHASPANMRRLPIRRVDFDDPAEKKQHDHIVALVEEMLQLQKEYHEANMLREDRRLQLKDQIDELDKEIDRAVYELYGLTEEEIGVVEGGTR